MRFPTPARGKLLLTNVNQAIQNVPVVRATPGRGHPAHKLRFKQKSSLLLADEGGWRAFLNGLIHIGEKQFTSGRSGEPASITLGNCIRSLGSIGTLEDRNSAPSRPADHRFLTVRGSSRRFRTDAILSENRRALKNKVCCYITPHERKNPRHHSRQHQAIAFVQWPIDVGSPLLPSIEDKVIQFHDKDRHQIVLDRRGRHARDLRQRHFHELPIDVQREILSNIRGLESATPMIRPDTAIESNFVQPTEVAAVVGNEKDRGFFLAGQINERRDKKRQRHRDLWRESMRLLVSGGAPLVLNRADAYIGIMIDDLVTKGTKDPTDVHVSAEFAEPPDRQTRTPG